MRSEVRTVLACVAVLGVVASGSGTDRAMALYDRLRVLKKAPHQVRAAALRGAVLAKGDEGVRLLPEALLGKDPVMALAATRVALELGGRRIVRPDRARCGRCARRRHVLCR